MDTSIAATVRTLHDMLETNGVAHLFEIYEGNHVNRISERVETKVMPFFSTSLAFPGAAPASTRQKIGQAGAQALSQQLAAADANCAFVPKSAFSNSSMVVIDSARGGPPRPGPAFVPGIMQQGLSA